MAWYVDFFGAGQRRRAAKRDKHMAGHVDAHDAWVREQMAYQSQQLFLIAQAVQKLADKPEV